MIICANNIGETLKQGVKIFHFLIEFESGTTATVQAL